MYTLTACVGLVWGLCGHVITAEYTSMSDCNYAASGFNKPNVTYVYCKPKEIKGK